MHARINEWIKRSLIYETKRVRLVTPIPNQQLYTQTYYSDVPLIDKQASKPDNYDGNIVFRSGLPAFIMSPANNRHRTNVGLTLAHRQRRWASVKTTLGGRVLFARVCIVQGDRWFHARCDNGANRRTWSDRALQINNSAKTADAFFDRVRLWSKCKATIIHRALDCFFWCFQVYSRRNFWTLLFCDKKMTLLSELYE